MIASAWKQSLSVVFSFILVATSSQSLYGYQAQSASPAAGENPTAAAPSSASELESLVAPIALYPDALVAQILTAATFPDQVAIAEYWQAQNKSLTGSALMQAVDKQSWDPSVKALTQFPSVLENMAKNLSWTSSLGQAFHDQQAEVMTAVQALRAKAKAAGNLKSSPQVTVVQQSPQVIVIQPTNPQIVYVPQYNPTIIYGTPYVIPAYVPPPTSVVVAGVIAFGAGIAVGAMMSGGCCGWGYSSWNCGWHGTAVVYHGGAYYGNAAWHGGYYGSSGSAYGAYGSAHYGASYNPSTGTYARGASVTNAYGTQKVGQAYNPYTGAYGATHQSSNAYGSYGSSVATKNGQTAYTQHQTTSQGSVGSLHTSNGGKAVAGAGAYNQGAAGVTANGDKYAAANGNTYKNTGSGWQKNGESSSNAFKGMSGHSGGYGDSGGGGWSSRADSSQGWGSMKSSGFSGGRFGGGGGGFGGGGFHGGGRR